MIGCQSLKNQMFFSIQHLDSDEGGVVRALPICHEPAIYTSSSWNLCVYSFMCVCVCVRAVCVHECMCAHVCVHVCVCEGWGEKGRLFMLK